MDILSSERLILREWRLDDTADLYEYACSDLVGPNAGWAPHSTEEESLNIVSMFIRNYDTYAIVLKSENKVIGSLGIHNRAIVNADPREVQREIGYVLNPKYWGHGYMPEAVMCVLDYGFNVLKLDRIWCGHFDFNYNSKRVIEKCGFNYKFSIDKKLPLLDNKEVNVLLYNISRDEHIN